jgi:hypothetical protein
LFSHLVVLPYCSRTLFACGLLLSHLVCSCLACSCLAVFMPCCLFSFSRLVVHALSLTALTFMPCCLLLAICY